MKISTALPIALLAGSALAAPARLIPRQVINDNGTAAYGSGITDLDILQYALTLEYLEISLYEIGLTKFSDSDFVAAGYSADDRSRFEEIINQELQHIATIQKTIKMMGETPTSPCEYSFGNPSDVQTFLNTTDAVNGLGPSAYLGSGAFLKDKMVLTVGASIGNIETQHHSWLNKILGRDAFPTAFLLPLSPTQAYSVAARFITSCPSSNPKLKAIQAYPPVLSVAQPAGVPGKPLYPGDTLSFSAQDNYTPPSGSKVAFLYGFNTTITSLDLSSYSAQIPSDCAGQAYAVVVDSNTQQGDTVDASNSLTGLAPFVVAVPASKFAGYNYQQGTY